jgi:hypothetical protein
VVSIEILVIEHSEEEVGQREVLEVITKEEVQEALVQ